MDEPIKISPQLLAKAGASTVRLAPGNVDEKALGLRNECHLAVVNSRCAHPLQECFSAQLKAMARLAKKNRNSRRAR